MYLFNKTVDLNCLFSYYKLIFCIIEFQIYKYNSHVKKSLYDLSSEINRAI